MSKKNANDLIWFDWGVPQQATFRDCLFGTHGVGGQGAKGVFDFSAGVKDWREIGNWIKARGSDAHNKGGETNRGQDLYSYSHLIPAAGTWSLHFASSSPQYLISSLYKP